jgi:hypothetical protein
MSDMATNKQADARMFRTCPASGAASAPVRLATVKALLTSTALRRVSRRPHFFCTDPRCAVVYFDEAGSQYQVDELRVPVWSKQPPGDRTCCYCFGESETSIRADRASVVTARIRAHVVAGRCACDTRNPSGHCCLGEAEKWRET